MITGEIFQVDGNHSGATAAVLGFILIASAWTDITSRRIPNWMMLTGIISSFIIQFAFSIGSLLSWGTGLLLGLSLFLPLYIMRIIGAGDVKLMSLVGSFLGPTAVISVILLTLISGGILAVGVAFSGGALKRLLTNTSSLMAGNISKVLPNSELAAGTTLTSAGTLPYAVAIATGTAIHLIMALNGRSLFG